MSLGPIKDSKDLTKSYQSLLLCAFTLQNPSAPESPISFLASTHALNGIDGPTFPGIGIMPAGSYVGRIAQQDIEALQQRSQLGIDRVARVTIHLMDPDNYVYNNYCSNYGFRGATLKMALVLWNVGTTDFTTDASLQFLGTCDMESPKQGGMVIEVSANNSHNTATVKLPNAPIQNRCFLYFPKNQSERLAAQDPASKICPYGPDVGGPGNTTSSNAQDFYGNSISDASGVFISCDFTRSNKNDDKIGCMARLGNKNDKSLAPDGNLEWDSSHRRTGAFAGVEWAPGYFYTITTPYGGGQIPVFNFINSAVLGQYHNMLYGKQFVQCKLANIVESGNDTKTEAMICDGDIGQYGISLVLANGIKLGQFGFGAVDNNLGWDFARSKDDDNLISTGGRNGVALRALGYDRLAVGLPVTGEARYKALGDPYGSIARIYVVMYKDIFTGFGTPTVQVLATGPKVAVFTDETSKTLEGYPLNANPAWVLLDVLTRSNWTYADVDIQSFIDAAAYCFTAISYVNAVGDSSMVSNDTYPTGHAQAGENLPHYRFKCCFSLEQRRTAADVIAGILRGFNGYLYWVDGKLHLGINRTLVDQQSISIPGSNYDTIVPSMYADQSAGNGYVAYSFDESNISRIGDGDNSRLDVEFESSATVQTPNKISIQFQNEDNMYVGDSLNEIDPDAAIRSAGDQQPGGSIVPETLNILGPPNFDQCVRIANVYMAERQRGNEADDARGTRICTIGTSVRAEHIVTGQIVLLTLQMYGIDKQMFRVLKKTVSTDFQVCKLTLQWHNDIWYTDKYGQSPEAFFSNLNLNTHVGPPSPWQPFGVQPSTDEANPLFSPTEWNFNVAEIDTLQADGSVLVQLQVSGVSPVNQLNSLPSPPFVPSDAVIGTGGSVPGSTRYYIQICALDAAGKYSAPSNTIGANVTGTGSNYTLTVNNITWMDGTVGYDLFVGTEQFNLTHAATADGTPTSISISSLPFALAYGPPDSRAYASKLQAKTVIHGGVIGINVSAVSGNTITLTTADSGLPLTINLSGSRVILIGKQGLDGADIPYVDFVIESSSGYVLSLDRSAEGIIEVNDIVLITSQATISSANTIGTDNYINPYSPVGVTPNDIKMKVRIVAGTGRYQIRTIQDLVRLSTSLIDAISDTTTSITVATGVNIINGQYLLLDEDEYVLVTTGGGSAFLTVTRGVLSSTAVAHAAGSDVHIIGSTYILSTPWTVIPDDTSVFIVEEPDWRYHSNSTQIHASTYEYGVVGAVDISNYSSHTMLVQSLIADRKDVDSGESRSPFRILWLYGIPGSGGNLIIAPQGK